MPLRSALASAGILEPRDIEVLHRVFSQLLLEGDTALDRESRAAALIRIYKSGVTSEEALLQTMASATEPDGANGATASSSSA